MRTKVLWKLHERTLINLKMELEFFQDMMNDLVLNNDHRWI